MIAYRMLYAVVVGLPVVLTVFQGAEILRRHAKPERWVWVAGLCLAFALPALYLAQSVAPPASASSGVEVAQAGESAAQAESDARALGLGFPNVIAVPGGGGGFGLEAALAFAWLLASTWLTLRWVVSGRRLARLVESWNRATVDGAEVWVTPDAGPAVAGVLRASVLVPDWLLSLPEEQRALVLLHEQEHVRARDPWLMGLVRAARIVTPWNPVVWALSSGLLRAVEMDCDRRVLRQSPDVRSYCDTLFAISARRPNLLVGAAAFAEPRISLQKRIVAMTTPPRSLSTLGAFALLGLGALLVFGSCGVPLPTERDADPRQSAWEASERGAVVIVVTPEGVVTINGEPHTIQDVSTVVGALAGAADRPLVASFRAGSSVPYRYLDQVQRELVEAGVYRVEFRLDPASGRSDALHIVMPESLEELVNVSQRNVVKLDVQDSGEVDVRRGEATNSERIEARAVEDLWREGLLDNPNLIASVSSQPGVTYSQVMAVLGGLHAANAQRISLWGLVGPPPTR